MDTATGVLAAADDEEQAVSTTPTFVQRVTDPALAADIADVAAATFPLACPPDSSPDDIAAYIADNLNADTMRGHILDTDSDVLIARESPDGPPVGYCLVRHGEPADSDVQTVITARPATEVSKMYVLPDHHTQGRPVSPSRALMEAAIDLARTRSAAIVWLGVNQENLRAQRFYTKMGFTRAGVKTFDLNGSVEHDYIMSQALDGHPKA
ncbi:GNAT family N-acetyltransferase [Gordonia sp. ABSL1-1]|uniref:GNAT family N-acetyltransferase n=1 Tax=Gordonia sp. ABSL1-1 TaxID=3053923 RepID=UPI0025741E56|nr:GNAT family N-acetyltransferase [Gordonia sp. ABSL1-1]MDL9936412.1 GNAT family N-acetyltransferase [Gordonia sp. ABSL1-1]